MRLAIATAALLAVLAMPVSPAGAADDPAMKKHMVQHLAGPPSVLLAGSSRVLKYDPRDVTKIARRSSFNAGVSSGQPTTAYEMYRFIVAKWPAARPHVVWGVDVEQFRPTNRPVVALLPPDGACVQGAQLRTMALQPFGADTSVFADGPSSAGPKLQLASVRAPGTWVNDSGAIFSKLGFRSFDFHDKAFQRKGTTLERRLGKTIATYTSLFYGEKRTTVLDATQRQYFEALLAHANARCDTPTIFLTPIHPKAKAKLGPIGFQDRREAMLDYFGTLHATYSFRVVDLTNLSTFSGKSTDFYDGVHMRTANTKRVLASLHRRKLLSGLPS